MKERMYEWSVCRPHVLVENCRTKFNEYEHSVIGRSSYLCKNEGENIVACTAVVMQ
jgi:hypothetical protein